jgi:hypothetical protein
MSILERRRHYRTNVTDTWAHCSCDYVAGRYAVDDLSQSGILLSSGPALSVETQLRMRLLMPGCDPVSLDGTVLRTSRVIEESSQYAIKFGFLSDDEQERIEDFIVQKLINELSPVVLVAGTGGWERKALIRSIRAIGYNAISVNTPLCVIRHLGFLKRPVSAIVLGTQFGQMGSLNIAAFLADHYPQIRRVLVARPSWRTRQAADKIVHTIVRRPWSEEHLRDAIKGI